MVYIWDKVDHYREMKEEDRKYCIENFLFTSKLYEKYFDDKKWRMYYDELGIIDENKE